MAFRPITQVFFSSSFVFLILHYADKVWVDKDNEIKTKKKLHTSCASSKEHARARACTLPVLLSLTENKR